MQIGNSANKVLRRATFEHLSLVLADSSVRRRHQVDLPEPSETPFVLYPSRLILLL